MMCISEVPRIFAYYHISLIDVIFSVEMVIFLCLVWSGVSNKDVLTALKPGLQCPGLVNQCCVVTSSCEPVLIIYMFVCFANWNINIFLVLNGFANFADLNMSVSYLAGWQRWGLLKLWEWLFDSLGCIC